MKRKTLSRKLFFLLTMMLFCTAGMYGQNIGASGVVRDAATNEPLAGVSVVQKDASTNGTMTDMDGKFSLTVPQGAMLVISYIGYADIELTAAVNLVVQMTESSQQLDEVVAIGYGTQRKSVVTAAISSVKAKDLEKLTPSRIENVLKGQVAGVSMTTGSGQPGSGSSVRVRGIGTTGDNDPLHIVDGMIVDGGIRNLNPADIQSVEILKDAASAAIYGTKGGNGVILITTKQGRISKPQITYEMNMGWANPWKKKEVLNTEEYMVLQNELRLNNGENLMYSAQDFADARAGLIPDTDWQDVAFNKNAPVVNHQISVQGGNEKMQYYVSFGYYDAEGILGGDFGVSNYSRYTIRSNNTYEIYNVENERKFLNKIKVGSNITYGRANSVGITTNQIWGTALGSATTLPPNMNVYLDKDAGEALIAEHPYALMHDGKVLTPAPSYFQEIRNPLAVYLRPDRTYDNEDKFIGSFWGEVNILKNLVFRTNYGFDLAFWGGDGHKYPYFQSENATAVANERTETTEVWGNMHRGFTWQIENTLTYDLKLSEHSITLLAGQSARKGIERYLTGNGYDLKVYNSEMAIIDNARMDRNIGGRYATGGLTGEQAMASYFGRVTYNYAERYMAQATLRYDGSYKFGTNNKWATFPSFSLGWNAWNEPYLQNIKPDWWDQLKLRGSWGKNGSDRIDAFAYMSLMESGLNYYVDGVLNYGISAGRLPNPNIRWEESVQTDLGADLTFLRGALTFSVDWFKKRTQGMLRQAASVPGYVGQSVPYVNAGIVDNTGWEFDIGYQFQPFKDFNIGIKANSSFVKNTVVDYGNASGENGWGNLAAAGIDNFIYQKNGYPNPFFYGYKTDGLFQNQTEADAYNTLYGQSAQPGDVRFVDADGNGELNASDRVMIGSPIPDWVYGLTLTADYKGFDLYVFFQGVQGNEIFDISKRADIPRQNLPAWILSRWTGEGTSNKIPRLVAGEANNNWRASDLYIKDGSYCRLKNIQFGYTLPLHISRFATIDRLRIWIGAENLLTFTKYDGFDPEIGDEQQGVDMGIYPQPRTISFGVGINF
ncbi:MAG: TonB-dependent receptor [Prevotellaceae bacterium]|jgi:TonB-linked SusC/RagA family outer membrane protein|nr:TonB-dependent receptor [Prevotellaceae bacterium]